MQALQENLMKTANSVEMLRRQEAEMRLKERKASDEAKRGELTISELQKLKDESPVYMSVGKAFIASKASNAVDNIKVDMERQGRQSKIFGKQYTQVKARREAEEKDMNEQFQALRRLQGK